MSLYNENTIRVLELVLQKKMYIHSLYVHTEGMVKNNLGRQLHHLKCIRSTLATHLIERLDAIIADNDKLKPIKKFDLNRRKTVKSVYHPPVKQGTLSSRQRALQLAISKKQASENAKAHGHTCNSIFFFQQNMYRCQRKTIGRRHCAYHGKLDAKECAVHATEESTPDKPQNAYLAVSRIPGSGSGVFAKITHRMNDVVTSYAYSSIVTKSVYKEEYQDKSRPECAYALRIGVDQIAIGIITPFLGKGIGSFVNTSKDIKRYPFNCKFVIHPDKVLIVCTAKAVKANAEFYIPYGRPL
jgi:hypothetical protein